MASNKYLIEYFTNDDLAYANRKRYKTFTYTASSSEYQYAVKLGDGASTSVKTAIANLCNYVKISLYDIEEQLVFETRWYVTSYIYLNGGQIEMFLQRDVIGENGLDGFFGKVERGYTETFLRNRKELSLNQILKNRTKLISQTNKYGNYTVNTHNNEKWGIIYLTKPTELDPLTGQPYTNTPSINIPAFAPQTETYSYIVDGTQYLSNINMGTNPIINFAVKFMNRDGTQTLGWYDVSFKLYYDNTNKEWNIDDYNYIPITSADSYVVIYQENSSTLFWHICSNFKTKFNSKASTNSFDIILPKTVNSPAENYNGAILEYNSTYIQYSVSQSLTQPNPTDLQTQTAINVVLLDMETAGDISYYSWHTDSYPYVLYYNTKWVTDTYNYVTLPPESSGTLVLDITQQLIDEPYLCYVFPLYDVTITGPNSYSKTIESNTAFMIFNTVIQACSGENSYLVDAQIYPYCPILTDIATSINNYPFFNISSSSFNTKINVELKPYLDIKKEYIKRDYYLVSPEQSANYSFNFYDYTNTIEKHDGDEIYNYRKLQIVIKTALKPMNIIASAVITPDEGALKGITYTSDLRGCQPTSNGFEFSLSTNKFQEYVRNNSNYQAIFALQQEELKKQHNVELTNDITSTIVNTATATAMGAIGGASLGSAGAASIYGTKAIGAAIGASTAGTLVGGAMTAQTIVNSELRDYEERLQKQNFDLQIGTIKNIPNTVSRISTFNEIIMKDFYFVIETYECSDEEGLLVDNFIEKYGYGLGIFGNYNNFENNGWFLRGTLITSNLLPIQHNVAQKEIMGGIYYYE